jgi:hypothetical protein
MGHAKFAKVTFHAAITSALAAMFGGAVACKDCASERQQIFSGKLTIAFPGIERVNFAPVYICAILWSAWTADIPSLSFPQRNWNNSRKLWNHLVHGVRKPLADSTHLQATAAAERIRSSSACNRGSHSREICKGCRTFFRRRVVTDEKTSRGCIHTAAFCSGSS